MLDFSGKANTSIHGLGEEDTATVVPHIVKMLSIADDPCTNATVGYMKIQPGIVACVIVNDIRRFWNLTSVNIVFSMNQAIECLM